jgi:hypothetical protein
MDLIMKKKNEYMVKIVALVVFAIAMGLLEAVVVVYLRTLVYPDGFRFPMKMLSEQIYTVEVAREAATLVMLAGVGAAAGRKYYDRLAYFLLTFAVWDIFYYVFLKVYLNWPATLLDWDILFLIPTTWIGPVLAPVLCSLAMILMAALILYFDRQGRLICFNKPEWAGIYGGALVIFLTFIRDYASLILSSDLPQNHFVLRDSTIFQSMTAGFVPQAYAWGWFAAGLGMILLALASWTCRTRQQSAATD